MCVGSIGAESALVLVEVLRVLHQRGVMDSAKVTVIAAEVAVQ